MVTVVLALVPGGQDVDGRRALVGEDVDIDLT
jgi:hypothetical protein